MFINFINDESGATAIEYAIPVIKVLGLAYLVPNPVSSHSQASRYGESFVESIMALGVDPLPAAACNALLIFVIF